MRLFARYAKQLIRQRRLILIIGNESAAASAILLILTGIIALGLLGKLRHLPLAPTLIITVVFALFLIPASWNSDKSPQHIKHLRYRGADDSFFYVWGLVYALLPAFTISLFALVLAAPPLPLVVLLGSTFFISAVSAWVIGLTEYITRLFSLNIGGAFRRLTFPFPKKRFYAYSFHLYKSGIILPYIVVFVFLSPAILYIAHAFNQPYGLFVIFIGFLCFDPLASLAEYEQKRRPLLQQYYYRVTIKESRNAKTFLVFLLLIPPLLAALVDIVMYRDMNSSLAVPVLLYFACALWALSYFYTFKGQFRRLTSLYRKTISILAVIPLMPFLLALYAYIRDRKLRRKYADHF